jgi:hypothetical protein
MQCVSKARALKKNKRLKKGFRYGRKSCIVPAGTKAKRRKGKRRKR